MLSKETEIQNRLLNSGKEQSVYFWYITWQKPSIKMLNEVITNKIICRNYEFEIVT